MPQNDDPFRTPGPEAPTGSILLWVAVLGLSIYALIGGVVAPDHKLSRRSSRTIARSRLLLGP